MEDMIESMGKMSPLRPLESVFITLGEELGHFLDKSIDRIFETLSNDKK